MGVVSLETKASERLSHGERAGRTARSRFLLDKKLISWGSSQTPTSGSIKHRLEGLRALALTSTVPFSLTCQDPGKKGVRPEVVRTRPSCRKEGWGRGQALPELALELFLWFPSWTLPRSAASCLSQSGEANFLQWLISFDKEREEGPN